MQKIEAKVEKHSITERGDELITFSGVFPRFILAELNTHRMFSRNSASSRAIPFKKMVEMIEKEPFIPIAWQKEHKGMQGSEYLTGDFEINEAKATWLIARDKAIHEAKNLSRIGVTKQLCNRLLEPFMWHKVLITTSKEGLENFFNLRCPQYQLELEEGDNGKRYVQGKSKKDFIKEFLKIYPTHGQKELVEDYLLVDDENNITPNNNIGWFQINKGQSEIHMMALAECMYDAYNESTPKLLKEGEWHIPFSDDMILNLAMVVEMYNNSKEGILNGGFPTKEFDQSLRIKIATAECARISYTTIGDEDKKVDYEKDIKLHDNLLESGHFSPFEHIARVMTDEEYSTFFNGQRYTNNHLLMKGFGWCNNFKGFIQYRYLIENK